VHGSALVKRKFPPGGLLLGNVVRAEHFIEFLDQSRARREAALTRDARVGRMAPALEISDTPCRRCFSADTVHRFLLNVVQNTMAA
jgi:hypothetical protein